MTILMVIVNFNASIRWFKAVVPTTRSCYVANKSRGGWWPSAVLWSAEGEAISFTSLLKYCFHYWSLESGQRMRPHWRRAPVVGERSSNVVHSMFQHKSAYATVLTRTTPWDRPFVCVHKICMYTCDIMKAVWIKGYVICFHGWLWVVLNTLVFYLRLMTFRHVMRIIHYVQSNLMNIMKYAQSLLTGCVVDFFS